MKKKPGPKTRKASEKGHAVTFYATGIAKEIIQNSKSKSKDISRWVVNGFYSEQLLSEEELSGQN